MRTRNATLPALFASFLALSVTGCGESGGSDTPIAAAPRPTKTALDLRKIPDANGVVSTAAPTTLAPPTTLPPTTVATTSTVLVPNIVAVSLPTGVTEEDRQAAEAAAIDWWEMFYRQLVALPNFDPQEILIRSAPGYPGGPAMLERFEKDKSGGFRFEPGSLQIVKILSIKFSDSKKANAEVCAADNGRMVQLSSGNVELSGLGASYFTMSLAKAGPRWLVADWGDSRPSIEGQSCDD